MKLSFVIPAYNEEAFIGKCLESILADAKNCFHEVEIIVVDNNSTDRTGEIAASYAGVKVVKEKNKGIVWARQAGYLAATGDIIANVDADNVLPNGWINKVFAEFSQNNGLVGLSGPLIYYDMSWLVNLEVKIFYILGYFAYIFNQFVFGRGNMLQGGNFIISRQAMEKIGGYNTDIVFYGEDTDVARRLSKVGFSKFTFSLPILSSGRRLSKEGVVISGLRYGINYFWILIFKRPFSKKSTDIRY